MAIDSKRAVSWEFRSNLKTSRLSKFRQFIPFYTTSTSFFIPVVSLKSLRMRVCCILTAFLCCAWLIAFGSVNSWSSWSFSDNFASIKPIKILSRIISSLKVPKLQCSVSVRDVMMNVLTVSTSWRCWLNFACPKITLWRTTKWSSDFVLMVWYYFSCVALSLKELKISLAWSPIA